MPIKPELLWMPRAVASDPYLSLPSFTDPNQAVRLRVEEIVAVTPHQDGGAQINGKDRTYYRVRMEANAVIALIDRARAGVEL